MHVINGSFIKIIQNLHRYEQINFDAWIKRICTNESIDYLRKHKRYKQTFLVSPAEGFSHKEISQSLGITVETSKWHTKMARKKLKDILANPLLQKDPHGNS